MATTDNLPVEIGSHRYVVDLKGLQYRPLNSIRQMQDLSREPSDATFDNQGVWKRTQSDFILGAGQNYLDQEDEADRRRFRKSRGIDIWDRRQMTLLNTVEQVASFTTGAGLTIGASIATENGLYFSCSLEVYYFDGTTWTICTGLGGSVIRDMTIIGGYVYVCDGNDLYRVIAGNTAFVVFSTANIFTLGTGGGRLIGSIFANQLVEINNIGGTTSIYTHFDANFLWNKIVAAPNGIYCFGDDASRSSIYMITVADATGALTPPYPVLQLPDGEFVRDALYFGGLMVLGTNLGFRLCTIGSSGFLTSGPLVEIGNVQSLATDGFDIWFSWPQYEGIYNGLGRMRPSRFTETLVPAYATDLMSTVSGAWSVPAVASFNGKRYFLVTDSGITRLFAEVTTKVASGSYHSGGVTYGTPERKAVHSIEGFWDALPAGSSVTIQVLAGLNGSAQSGGVFDNTTGSTTQRGPLDATYEGEETEVLITLTRATTTTLAPVVRRWTLRAMPMAYRTFEIVLPLVLSTTARHQAGGHDQTIYFDPQVEFEYLLGLVQNRSAVTLTIGSRSENVIVDALSIGPDVETVGASDWTRTQNWIEGVWALRLLTIEPGSGIVTPGGGSPSPSSSSYVHEQPTPSDTWTVVHDLGYYPAATCVDTDGVVLIATVDYVSLTTIIISHASAIAGRVFLS